MIGLINYLSIICFCFCIGKDKTQLMKRTLIFLHGLGDSGKSWSDLARSFSGFKCIFPDAPSIEIYINGNMRMPGWYNLYQLGPGREDEPGLLKTRQYLQDLIQKEIDQGVQSKDIFIGGFSQGAVCALLAGLTIPIMLGGIIAFSGYLPIRDFVAKQQLNPIPVFMGHGKQDPVIPYSFSQLSKQVLEELKVNLVYKSYNMEHSACVEEIQDVQNWLSGLEKDEL